ncbi:MAG: hypothetical protein H0X25_11975 [Acidobacteriales bacterium]|nr:hypothetical protein [Terriglobales bacterium]
MTKRGKVLRDASAGPGLLMVGGEQYPFSLEGVWRSEVPAKAGMAVQVEFDSAGQIAAITAVPESQIAREQADKALAAAKDKGGEMFGRLVAKVGMPTLVAGALLAISWLWLTAVSIQLPLMGKLEFTFWEVLGFLNTSNMMEIMERSGHPSAGAYGLFALVCLAGPFIHYFWKDKRAVLGGVLPLAFMGVVGLMVRSAVNNAVGGDASAAYGMQKQAQDEMMNAISVGLGVYLSVLASLYFAGVAVKNYLSAKTMEPQSAEKSRAAAA